MITEILGGLGGVAKAAAGGPSSAAGGVLGNITLGSRTLGTGAQGGDTAATAPNASASGGSTGGNSQMLWIVGIIAAAAVIFAFVFKGRAK